jgi:urease accessory protein
MSSLPVPRPGGRTAAPPVTLLWLASLLVLPPLILAAPASAHHVMGLFRLTPGPLAGILSGLGHPLLGPDHLLFLLSVGLVALRARLAWVMALLATGLAASGVGLALPGLPGAEALVALSLVAVGLVLLDRLPRWVLLPAIALHGYVLSGSVIGWESTPVAFYLFGLFLSQATLLVLSVTLVRRWAAGITTGSQRLLAGMLIGVGAALTWSTLVP